jgi:hypothetical protein
MTPSDGKRQVWIIPGDLTPELPAPPAVEAPGHRIVAAPIARRRRRPEPRSLRLLVRAYSLGPLGTLLGGASRWEQVLAVLALMAGVFWVLLQLPPVAAGLPAAPRLAAMLLCGSFLLGAWCRELVLAAGQHRLNPERLPAWMRRSATAGFLGLPVPGLGLLIAGRSGRAALAFFNAGLTVQALLIVVGLSRELGPWGVSTAVEVWLAGAALAFALGALLWVASALDGARLLAGVQRRPRVVPADRYALALLLALVLFSAGFQPADFAGDLDGLAVTLQERGFRHLPLACELWALRLDPGRPEYALRAADLAGATDRPVLAGALLYSVRERWQVCALRFGRQPAARSNAVREDLIGPMIAH